MYWQEWTSTALSVSNGHDPHMERQGVSCPPDYVTCSYIHDGLEMLIVEYAVSYLFYDVFITVLCVK